MTRLISLLIFIASFGCATAENVISDNFLDCLPEKSERINGYTRKKVENYLSTSTIHRIEGIWQFTASGVMVVVERFQSSDIPDGAACYRMVLLRAPERSVVPGLVMGYIAPTARKGVYDSRIYTDFDGQIFLDAKRFTITMNDDARLSFKPEKKGLRFSFYHLFPRLLPRSYRFGLSGEDTRDASLDGCIRVFPEPTDGDWIEPRYL